MATEAETLIHVQELPVSQEVAILDNSLDIKETEAPLSVPEITDDINDLLDDHMTPNTEDVSVTNQNGKGSQKVEGSLKSKNGPVLKSKKKEDKGIDHILRALSSLDTTEEKLAALCKKYADLHEEHRVLQVSFKQAQRKMSVISREKDQIQSEHTKAVMGKSKLESLCRELQKHNKLIKEESIQRAKEEDEKRKEISSKFQTTIGEIQQQMQDNHERNSKLREENADLAGKLKGFIEKYEIREEQLEKLMKHKEIEQQLADAKLQQASLVLKQEQERGKREKDLLTQQTEESLKKSGILEAQLGMYKDRYEDFQTTINKSNDVFQKFKTEMDKMSKRIKKLEKETATWKAKWQGCNKALLDMVEEKQKNDQDRLKLQSKTTKLESLCRALQNELHGKKVVDVTDSNSKGSTVPPISQAEPELCPEIISTVTSPPTDENVKCSSSVPTPNDVTSSDIIPSNVSSSNPTPSYVTPSSSCEADTANTKPHLINSKQISSESVNEGEVTSTTETPEPQKAADMNESADNSMNEVD